MDAILQEGRNRFVALEVRKRLQMRAAPGLVFVRFIEHGLILQRLLTELLGIDIPFIQGGSSRAEKLSVMEKMRTRSTDTPVAVCTSTWSTGVDIPALRWVMWAGQGQAPIGLIQARGRGSRTAEGKDGFEFIIIEDLESSNYREQADKRIGHLADLTSLGRDPAVRQGTYDSRRAALLETLLTSKESYETTRAELAQSGRRGAQQHRAPLVEGHLRMPTKDEANIIQRGMLYLLLSPGPVFAIIFFLCLICGSK